MSLGLDSNKDILANIAAGAAGDGYITPLSGARAYSIQLVVASPAGLSGCTVTVSSSNDRVNWVALTPVAVTTATTAFLATPTNYAKWIKVTKAISGGTVSIKCFLAVQKEG